MSTLPKTRIRIKADLFNLTSFTDELRDTDSDYVPKFRAGDDVQFEIGFFNNGTLQDISSIASVTLEIKPLDEDVMARFDSDLESDKYDLRGPDLSLTPIRSKMLPAAALNPALTEPDWDTKAAAHSHAIIGLDSVESNIAAGDRWLTVGVVTNDNPGRTRTVSAGLIRVLGGGLSQSSEAINNPEDFYNKTESDSRYLQQNRNLADLANATAARDNLGLGAAALAGLLDEDGLASDSATDAPSQQSVKAYVDDNLATKADSLHSHSESEIIDLDKYTRAEVHERILRETARHGFSLSETSGLRGDLSLLSPGGNDFIAGPFIVTITTLADRALIGTHGLATSIGLNTNGTVYLKTDDGTTLTTTATLGTGMHALTFVRRGNDLEVYLGGTLLETLGGLAGKSLTFPAATTIGENFDGILRGPLAMGNYAPPIAEIIAGFNGGLHWWQVAERGQTRDEAYLSDFSTTADGWGTGVGTVTASTGAGTFAAGEPPSDDWLIVSKSGGSGPMTPHRNDHLIEHRRYRIEGNVFVPGNSGISSLRLRHGGIHFPGDSLITLSSGDVTSFTYEGFAPATGVVGRLGFALNDEGTVADGDAILFKDIRTTLLGHTGLWQLDDGLAVAAADAEGRGMTLLVTGAQPLLPASAGNRAVLSRTFAHDAISTDSGTTELLEVPTGWAVIGFETAIETVFDSGSTLDIGTSADSSRYASALALASTGRNYTASSDRSVPDNSAATMLYLTKNEANTQGAVTVTLILEKR